MSESLTIPQADPPTGVGVPDSGGGKLIDDFGDSLGPMVVKELRQGLRARRFVAPFLLIHVLAIFAVLSEAAVAELATGSASRGGGFVDGMLVFVISLVIGLIMPLTGFGALRPELEGGRNVELLLLANVTRWQIVLGKWLVMCSLSGLILISLVPYLMARHFIGGVNIVVSLTFLVGLGMSNATLNGLMIGASGFGNYLGRLLVLGIGAVSFSITTVAGTFASVAAGAMSAGMGANDSAAAMLFATGLSLIPSALYCVYGLQLGRSRLRLFEDPTEPPASGLIIAMMIFTPLFVGILAGATAGIGGVIAALALLVLVLFIDRGPGKKQTLRYAQP